MARRGIAALLGPPLAGYMFDLTGSYQGPILASAAAAAMAGLLTLRLGQDGQRAVSPVLGS